MAKAMIAASFMVFLWGGITAGPTVAAAKNLTDMGYTLIDLGTLGGSSSRATAINDKGQVIGESATAGDLATHAFLYSNGIMNDLGTLGGTYSRATAINKKGQVVGASDTAENMVRQHPFLYSDGTMTDLTQLADPRYFLMQVDLPLLDRSEVC